MSIIIPVLDEADSVTQTLASIKIDDAEILVVDGGSTDDTVAIASQMATVIPSARGRAAQMNAGAAKADGDILLFLHADTHLPHDADRLISDALSRGAGWGRFDVRLSGERFAFRIIERFMNWRSCLTSVATGDQAMFVDSALFEQVGGFPDMPLMEDIALSKQLRRYSKMACIDVPVVTSSRRWQQHGIIRTVLLMWWLRLLYFAGVSPQRLSAMYS